jgi:hypothetical protein
LIRKTRGDGESGSQVFNSCLWKTSRQANFDR